MKSTSLRMSPQLLDRLKDEACRSGRSLNSEAIFRLERSLGMNRAGPIAWFDIITPKGVAVDVKDVVGDISCPELIGRLVDLLVRKEIVGGGDLQNLLPAGYKVRAL